QLRHRGCPARQTVLPSQERLAGYSGNQVYGESLTRCLNRQTHSALNCSVSRRQWMIGAASSAAWLITGFPRSSFSADEALRNVADDTFSFVRRCARADGGYSPSPDPKYSGNSDTGSSDLAAVTYAATLARTMGWQLPYGERS